MPQINHFAPTGRTACHQSYQLFNLSTVATTQDVMALYSVTRLPLDLAW